MPSPSQASVFQPARPPSSEMEGDGLPFSDCRSPLSGFTLLELCLAIFIGLLILAAAVPSLSGLLDEKKGKATFVAFNDLVQEARTRSVEESRPYVLLWTDEGVTLQADGAHADEEAKQLTLEEGDSLKLDLPAALKKSPEAIWTFWPSGTCEPATVIYKGKTEAWSAVFNPFTASAEVTYE